MGTTAVAQSAHSTPLLSLLGCGEMEIWQESKVVKHSTGLFMAFGYGTMKLNDKDQNISSSYSLDL